MKPTTILLAPLAFAVGTQAITLAECRIACESGQEAMERFCRGVSEARLRAACWGLAIALDTKLGQTACANWCYWQWGDRKRDVIQVLEGRQEISLATDFALTGLVLPGEPKA